MVSLTTYSKRIQTVYLTIESIGRGSLRPSAVLLWLDEQDLVRNPPSTLKRLLARGLQIRACKDYGPHKKYYPYVASTEKFSVPLATADDDVFYPREWLNDLNQAHLAHPGVINCNKARLIPIEGGRMASYSYWSRCQTTAPSYRHFATGVSGIIYPPSFLSVLKEAGERFLDRCPRADDIWLHAQAVRSGYRIRQIRSKARDFLFIPGSQEVGLYLENVKNGQNDTQMAATYEPEDLAKLAEGDTTA